MPNTLINVDLSQAELRVMACLSQDAWMINALQEDAGDFFDTHLMPISWPKKLEKWNTVDEWKLGDPVDHKEARTVCKAIVYGLSFGRGPKAIGESVGLSTRDAQGIIDNLFDVAPQWLQWRKDVMEAAVVPSKREFLTSPFGRKFQSEIITNRNKSAVQREALSFLPQSTASDIVLVTAIRIQPVLAEMSYDIFNIVHDAIMIEGDDDSEKVTLVGEYVMQELRETGRSVFGDIVPFLSEYSSNVTWGGLT